MAPPVEISIPTTSISSSTSDGKPYTLYTVTLRLPLRSYVVQKRYSEFATLHTGLTSLTGSPPPAPLPAKSWFKSTVSSPDLTETRRAGLERYLRAVAESPDRSWRDTPAWRAFLNLPATSSTAGSAASVPTGGLAGPGAAAAASDPATWLDLHREMRRALHDARLHLARRDGAERTSAAASEAGVAAKRELFRAGSLLSTLGDGLKTLRVGEGELRRRKDLVAAARVERDGLEKLSASLASGAAGAGAGSGSGSGRMGQPSTGDRHALLGSGPRAGGRVLGAPLPETERTRELGNEGVVQLQKTMMEEQDHDVRALGKVVQRQREMGLLIKEEVDVQTEMLKRMDEDVDRVAAKTKIAKDRVRRLG